jgi:hypothetical protein
MEMARKKLIDSGRELRDDLLKKHYGIDPEA